MRSDNNRLVILKTALLDEVGNARLNTWAMGDKGGERVVEVRRAVRSECLVGNATMDRFAIDESQKPDNPSGGIIRFTRGEFYTHDPISFARTAY
jgi:hypothetical protein